MTPGRLATAGSWEESACSNFDDPGFGEVTTLNGAVGNLNQGKRDSAIDSFGDWVRLCVRRGTLTAQPANSIAELYLLPTSCAETEGTYLTKRHQDCGIGNVIGTCGEFGTKDEIEAACDEDPACLAYSLKEGKPWCRKSSFNHRADPADEDLDQDYVCKVKNKRKLVADLGSGGPGGKVNGPPGTTTYLCYRDVHDGDTKVRRDSDAPSHVYYRLVLV